jgi:hypothetical protein
MLTNMRDKRWVYSPSKDLLINLWLGDRIKLRERGNPIAEIKEVKMIGRGHDNALYTVEMNNGNIKDVRSWDIILFAFKLD